MRIIKLPLPFYDAEGGSGGGASGPSSSGSAAPSTPPGASSSTSASPSSGSEGGAPNTPSSAPEPGGGDPSSSPSGDDFSGLGNPTLEDLGDDLLEGVGTPAPAVEPVQQTPQPPPVAPQPQPAPAASTAPVDPNAQPSAQPTGQPTPSSPPLSLDEPGLIAEALMSNQEEIVNNLAAKEFALTDKDLEALEKDAPGHIPHLLARAHLKSQVNLWRQLAQVVPRMVQKQIGVMRKSMEAENAFYSAWPQLDRQKHGPIIQQYATLFRQANPQATRQQMIEALGPIVMHAAKVTPGPMATAPNGQGGAPVLRTPAQPFQPARPGVPAMPQPQEANEWAGLGQQFDEPE